MAAEVETSCAGSGTAPNHADERAVIANLLLDPREHPIIGHRGASGLAPENTVVSFDLARSAGAEAFEFDIQLSADLEPVHPRQHGGNQREGGTPGAASSSASASSRSPIVVMGGSARADAQPASPESFSSALR